MVCNKVGAKIAIFNGFICKECYDKSYDYLSNSVDISQRRVREIEDAISKYVLNQEELNKFKGTKKIGTYIEIDEENQMFQVLDSFGKHIKDAVVYRYGDITRFELVEDGFVINKQPGRGIIILIGQNTAELGEIHAAQRVIGFRGFVGQLQC